MALTKNAVVVDPNSVGSYTSTVTATSDVILFDTPNTNAAFLQVTGTAAGFTYVLEGTLDGTTWVSLYYIRKSDNAISPAITQNDVYYANVASFIQVRLTVSAIASGSSTLVFASNAAGSFLIGQQSGASAGSNTTTSGTITASGQSVTIGTQGMNTVAVSITGTFSTTLVFDGVFADGTTMFIQGARLSLTTPYVIDYTNSSVALTIPGKFFINCAGLASVRVRSTVHGSGTVSVSLSVTDGTQLAHVIQGGTWNVNTAPLYKNTYSAAIVGLVPAATPTDIFTIFGGTIVTKIKKIRISGTQTTAAIRDILLIKRSTVNTLGTSTTLANVPHLNNIALPVCVVKAYTANPTLGTGTGTAAGPVRADKILVGTTTGAADRLEWTFGENASQPIELLDSTQCLSINLNSVTSAGNLFNIYIEWTEE